MMKLKYIPPLLGILLIGFCLFKTVSTVEAGSIQSMQAAMKEYRYLAFLGFACFWALPVITWFQSKSKINFPAIFTALKDDIYPSYGRQLPLWIHALRLIGAGAFIYFLIQAVEVINDDMVFHPQKAVPAGLGAVIFFFLPFVFAKKVQ